MKILVSSDLIYSRFTVFLLNEHNLPVLTTGETTEQDVLKQYNPYDGIDFVFVAKRRERAAWQQTKNL